jgi:prefoldin subunit 5
MAINNEDLKTIHKTFNSSLKNVKKNLQELNENIIILKGELHSIQSSYQEILIQLKETNIKHNFQTRKLDFTLSRLINLKEK